MDPKFWLDRWEAGRTGFHLDEVHPSLTRFGPRLLGEGRRRVLVPLCGKSHDLDWLLAQGHEVTGVELSPVAVEAVFARLGVTPEVEPTPWGRRLRHGRLTLLEGDALRCELPEVDAIWDRAALIALDPGRRPAYADRLRAALAPGGRVLIVTVQYDPTRMPGPPHSVDGDELRARFPGFRFERLDEEDLAPVDPRWRERGLDELLEVTRLLTPPL